jgi:hypothetical protein
MVGLTDKLTAKKSYFYRAYLGSFPYNLVRSGNLADYYQILTDFEFIAGKVNHPELGVQVLIDDYDLIEDSELLNHPEYNSEKVKALKLIQGALRLSAHILAEDKTQLAGQLWGRLLSFKMPEIQALLVPSKAIIVGYMQWRSHRMANERFLDRLTIRSKCGTWKQE